MNVIRLRVIASTGLVVGAILGMAGTFVSTASLRGLAGGLAGIALVVGSVLLAIHHFRQGQDLIAAGFVVFTVGEGLLLSGAAMDPVGRVPSFGASAGLWAAALALISLPKVFPTPVRSLGLMTCVLCAVQAVQLFIGRPLTPLSVPLPFYAYPSLAATIFGWAWVHLKAVKHGSLNV